MDENLAKWQKELISFRGIKSVFLIEGNINDIYYMSNPVNNLANHPARNSSARSRPLFNGLNETLNMIFNPSKEKKDYDMLFCDPLVGFFDPLVKSSAQHEQSEMWSSSGDISKSLKKSVRIWKRAHLLETA